MNTQKEIKKLVNTRKKGNKSKVISNYRFNFHVKQKTSNFSN